MKLTERSLAKIVLPSGKSRVRVWDSELTGFGVVIGKRAKTFVAQRRVAGKLQLVSIGKEGDISPSGWRWNIKRARAEALRVLADMAEQSEIAAAARDSHTLRDGIKLHVKHLKRRNKSPKTIETLKNDLSKHMGDYLDCPIEDIDGEVLENAYDRIIATAKPQDNCVNPPGQACANRVVSHVSVVWNALDKKYDLDGKNPARRITRGELKPKSERINDGEFEEWYRKVLKLSPIRRDLQLLTLFTAMRSSSILPLRWEHIDFDGCMAHVWAKGDKPYSVPLSVPAIAISRRRQTENATEFKPMGGDDGWVFPSLARSNPPRVIHVAGSRQMAPDSTGKMVKTLPGLHPLRRTHNSVGMEIGVLTEHRERLLNHNGQGVNVRVYGRPQNWDFIAECQEKIANALLERLGVESV